MRIQQLLESSQKNKTARISLHVLFWLLLTTIQGYLLIISFNPYNDFPLFVLVAYLLSGTVAIILFYYPLVYFVIPGFIYKKKIIKGIVFIAVLLAIYTGFDVLRENLILVRCASCMESLKANGSGYYSFLMGNNSGRWLGKLLSMGAFISLIFSIAIPLSIKWGLQALRQQLHSTQLEKENLQLEFDFLRSQVNPHFLFNTLNNIYGQVVNGQKDKAADLIAQLSYVLRYTLYESAEQFVPIDKEIKFLQDYIQLESVRLNHTIVKFDHRSDESVKHIAPLLLVPIIENAFKYCDDAPGAGIEIQVIVNKKHVTISIQNTINPSLEATNGGGIGQDNFRKRLHLYYPDRHTLKIERINSIYSVIVNINDYEENQVPDRG